MPQQPLEDGDTPSTWKEIAEAIAAAADIEGVDSQTSTNIANRAVKIMMNEIRRQRDE